jgi:hypothetical protein
MNRRMTHPMVAWVTIALWAASSHACSYPPDVWIGDWKFYVSPGQPFDVTADEYSGTYVDEWWWELPPGSGGSEMYVNNVYGVYGSSTLRVYFDNPGVWQFNAYARNTDEYMDHDYARAYVIRVTIDDISSERDTDDHMAYKSATPADIYYTIEPDDTYRYTVTLYIKDGLGNAIRTIDLTSLGLGEQHTTWDGKKDDGTWAPPGKYTTKVELGVGDYASIKFSGSHSIYVVTVQLPPLVVVPVDNGGADPAIDPEPILGDFRPNEGLAYPVVPDNDYYVAILGPNPLYAHLSHGSTSPFPPLPEPVFVTPCYTNGEWTWTLNGDCLRVDGLTPGVQPISITYRRMVGSTPNLDVDEVIASANATVIVTETISRCPTNTSAAAWVPSDSFEIDDAVTFREVTEDEGYAAQSQLIVDSAWPYSNNFTMNDFKDLSHSGMLHMISHEQAQALQYKGGYPAYYSDSQQRCIDWMGGETGMEVVLAWSYPDTRYCVVVHGSWFASASSNWASNLNARNAIVHWAAGGSQAYSEAGGGRVRIAYVGAAGVSACDVVTTEVLKRMDGTYDNGLHRTVDKAWTAASEQPNWPPNVSVAGNFYTTLCPAVVTPNGTWPQSRPTDPGYYGGAIIFDTVMDPPNDDAPATNALSMTGSTVYGPMWRDGFYIDFTYDRSLANPNLGTATLQPNFCLGGDKATDGYNTPAFLDQSIR